MSLKKGRFNKLWLPIQSVALLSAIISPVLFKMDRNGSLERSLHPDDAPKLVHVVHTSEKPETITSSTLVLPSPEKFQNHPLEVEFYTTQLRFEVERMKVNAANELRAPASVNGGWELSDVRRKNSAGEWEDLDLLFDDGSRTLSSFIELSEGSNEFQATFKNARGKSLSYSIRVRRSRMGG